MDKDHSKSIIIWIVLAVAIVALIGGIAALVTQTRQSEIEQLKQEVLELRQATESNQVELITPSESPTSSPGPESSPSPASQVPVAPKQAPAVKGVTKSTAPTPDTMLQLSKQEECEAEVLKARVDGKAGKRAAKQKIRDEPKLRALEDQRGVLLQAIQDADNIYDIQSIGSTLESLDRTLDIAYDGINASVDKVFEDMYEKMLSDCLNAE